MAHECPICYQQCYCGGDIDDICMDGTEEQLYCTHCDENEDPDDENDYESMEELP